MIKFYPQFHSLSKGLVVGVVIFRNYQISAGFDCGPVARELVYDRSQKSQGTEKTLVCSIFFHSRNTDSSGDFITHRH